MLLGQITEPCLHQQYSSWLFVPLLGICPCCSVSHLSIHSQYPALTVRGLNPLSWGNVWTVGASDIIFFFFLRAARADGVFASVLAAWELLWFHLHKFPSSPSYYFRASTQTQEEELTGNKDVYFPGIPPTLPKIQVLIQQDWIGCQLWAKL